MAYTDAISAAIRSQVGGRISGSFSSGFASPQPAGAQTSFETLVLSHAPHHESVLFAMMLWQQADIKRRSS